MVVIDGLESFSEGGLRLAARLVAALRGGHPGRGRVALTVRPEGFGRLQAALAAAGVTSESCGVLVVQPPGESEVNELLGHCPGLASAARWQEFRSLVRNLKVFDWAAQLAAAHAFEGTGEVRTPTALIARLWEHFVERGAGGLVGALLLKRAAVGEADLMLPGLPVSEVTADELAVLPTLEAVGFVRRLDERVRFVHDLVADWARLKYLVEWNLPGSEPAVRRAATAGWYRAVRLYAQHVLETPGVGVDRWRQCVQTLGTGIPERAIVRDLFVEALVLADDASNLLGAAWPALVAGDGELLHLLIARFWYVGTIPDATVQSTVADRAEASRLEHVIRVPFEPYWAGVLPVLAERDDDVIRCALAPAAKFLHLWLSTVSPRRRDTARLRDAAARLILSVAREVQAREAEERNSVEEDVRADVYVALLWAAPDCPKDVAQLCLELANRRAEATPVRQRRETTREANRRAREQLPVTDPEALEFLRNRRPREDVFGPKRDPWPDGPRHRVDEAFQKACTDYQAIFPLAVNRPQEALDVMLGVLIDHTTCRVRASLALSDCRPGEPPFYNQGPFWNLLRSSDETAEFALTLIIRVVNFATERWREGHDQFAACGPDPTEGPRSVRVFGPDGWVDHHGNRNVLRWHDGWRANPSCLSSMLMAVDTVPRNCLPGRGFEAGLCEAGSR